MVFLNSFLSYLILMLVFAAAGGLAIFLGITLRKKRIRRKPDRGVQRVRIKKQRAFPLAGGSFRL